MGVDWLEARAFSGECRVHPLRLIAGLGVVFYLFATPVAAGPVGPTYESCPHITESTRARLLVHLTQGDIAGAIAMYEAHTGQQAPVWLRGLQVAYSAASQVPGKCQEVSRMIHTAFSNLGKSPEFVAFKGKNDYMMFEFASGKQVPVTRTG